jgi:hypothetical protein
VTPEPRAAADTLQGETFMRRTRYSFILCAILSSLVAAMLAATSPQAIAQDQQMAPPDFSQEQIEAFAGAAIEVQRVKTEFDAQAAQAANPEEVARLQQQAQAEASKAVEDSGLSVDEYTQIAQAATADPALYAQIVGLMRQQAPQ